MSKSLSLALIALSFICKSYSQCSSVRGGTVKFSAVDTLITDATPAAIYSFTLSVYYDASNICGDTVIYNTMWVNNASASQKRKLFPINGTDINSDGILDGVLLNSYTRMCVFKVNDTLQHYGIQQAEFDAGNYVPNILNIPNSGTTPFVMTPNILISANLGSVYDKRSIVFQNSGWDVNTVGTTYTYDPQYAKIGNDSDSLQFSLALCNYTATEPASSSTFSVNPKNGIVTWDAPTTSGLSNFRIQESDYYNTFSVPGWVNNGVVFSEIQVLTQASTTGINLFEVEKKPFVFPNPTADKIHIVNNNQLPSNLNCTIKIYDLAGKEIKSVQTTFVSEIIIDVKDIYNGEYLYEILNQGASVQKGKFIKQ